MEEIRKVLWDYYENEEDVERYENEVRVYEAGNLDELGRELVDELGVFDGSDYKDLLQLYFNYEEYADDYLSSFEFVEKDDCYYIWEA